MTTLTITVGRGDQLEEETIDRIRAAEAGDELEDDDPVLNFDSYATLARFLSDRNLELLEVIAREQPRSIRAAAELVDRDYREVHRNLTELEDLGLITFEGGEPGRAKTPVIEYDDIDIRLPLGSNEEPVAA
ncbi:MAG: transcriptional regulator [Halobacteriales archaeon]